MTISSGSRTLNAEPNVTPLIDVLLVLLVIFMIVTPNRSRGLRASVPQEASQQDVSSPSKDVVVTVQRDRTILLNREVVTLRDLDARLRAVFAAAPNHVLFVRGDRDFVFQQVAAVIDVAKGAGLTRIGLMTK